MKKKSFRSLPARGATKVPIQNTRKSQTSIEKCYLIKLIVDTVSNMRLVSILFGPVLWLPPLSGPSRIRPEKCYLCEISCVCDKYLRAE
jgi:hypothetical protein